MYTWWLVERSAVGRLPISIPDGEQLEKARKKLFVSRAIQGRMLRHVAVYWLTLLAPQRRLAGQPIPTRHGGARLRGASADPIGSR